MAGRPVQRDGGELMIVQLFPNVPANLKAAADYADHCTIVEG